MPKVLILGSYGLLGNVIYYFLSQSGYQVFRHGRHLQADFRADCLNYSQLAYLFENLKPDITINLVALTNVDLCEKEPGLAKLINVTSTKNIANLCRQTDSYLIHISTDQLYNGEGPHKEENVCPINVYAKTKLESEAEAMKCNSIVLRTNFVGRSINSKRKSFTDWILNEIKNERKIKLFDDVIFSPLHMNKISELIDYLIHNKFKGVFNAGTFNCLTKANFGLQFIDGLGLSRELVELSSITELNLYAKRPHNMFMDVSKIESILNFKCPSIKDSVNYSIAEYLKK